jgi:hypothetical protein
MILEYLAPGARRRTHTAGTTEASLLGLLDVGIHGRRVLKQGGEVNTTFCAAQQAAEKVIYFVILSEAKNLSSI